MSKYRIDVSAAGVIVLMSTLFGVCSLNAIEPADEETVKSTQEIVEALAGGVRTRGIVVEASQKKTPARIDLDIRFEFGSQRLSSQARTQLAALGEALNSQRLASQSFEIIGHTDGVGSAAYNLRLSGDRAAAVRGYLLENHAVAPERLSAKGLGEEQLLPGVPPEDSSNRRVEIRTR